MDTFSVLHDVTHKVWQLVEAIHDHDAIEEIMNTDIYDWWAQYGNQNMTLQTNKDKHIFNDISDLMGNIRDTLKANCHPRSREFEIAYQRMCTWCDIHDVAESMEGVHVK